MTDTLRDALADRFGFPDFQPGQRPIIDSVLSGRPTLAIMPTGAGKSLCYQLPAVVLDGLTIVVSPLIALMKDQVDALTARGIRADLINSSRTPSQRDATLGAALNGELDLLYVAPERFGNRAFRDRIAAADVALFAIDEAHCISRWGHDFRPDYRRLAHAIGWVAPERILACTATATPHVRDDIASSLGLEDPEVFVSGFLRPNLSLDIRFAPSDAAKRERLDDFLTAGPGAPNAPDPGAVIVYAPSRKQVESLSVRLTKRIGEPVLGYHAGMDAATRDEVQDRFIGGDVRIVVATNAFGMGVDRADVRAVVHVTMPRTVEGYYQEIGRAGRDGRPSWCLMLTGPSDSRIHEYLIAQSENEAHRQAETAKLAAMKRFVHSKVCRHRYLLTYFGERMDVPCPGCTRCQPPPRFGGELPDATDESTETVRKALAGVARSKEKFGLKRVAGMLAGSRNRSVKAAPLSSLSTFGILGGLGVAGCEELLWLLVDEGLCTLTGGEYPLLALTERGTEVMLGRDEPNFGLPGPWGRMPTRTRSRRGSTAEVPDECDPRIVDALRSFRRDHANGKPLYTVFSNAVLYRLAALPPNDRESFMSVAGLGKQKWERFGPALLDVVSEAQQA